ncbi:polysaccharide biosynthesis C-terminal domain-containing protein, partial [uncultured Veillonella sp.]|uniref:lipid II flippase MurJ n=1 Tax=uncultured Veillonella sp. TaxID=159268 RepID=UPI00342F26DF
MCQICILYSSFIFISYDVTFNNSINFFALFNVGAAFFRADGNARYPMMISVVSNVLNIIGNGILIFGCSMGVAGAAISTLISRVFCMVVIF